MAKKSTEVAHVTPPPGVLVPAVTSFDFLEGGFARAERSRLIGLVTAGLALVGLASALMMGGVTSIDAAVQQDALDSANLDAARVNAQLAAIDQAGGIPTALINSHIQSRQAAMRGALGDELDTVRILRDLQASAPSGVTIENVTFGSVGESKDKGKDAAAAGAKLTLKAKLTAFSQMPPWTEALRAITGLSDLDMTWEGGGDSITATVTATLTDEAKSPRAAAGNPAAAAASPNAGSVGTDPAGTSLTGSLEQMNGEG